MPESLKQRALLLAAAALVATLAGCVTVSPPDKPIEINLNVKIEQEVLVKLERDVEQLMKQNPQDVPAPKKPGTQR
jgi:hypothetical protein